MNTPLEALTTVTKTINIARKAFCIAVLASSLPLANASIVDTADNSFIDTSTGLEWMDFGINNQQSYRQVVDNLTTQWAGWHLATQDQVLTMMANAFGGKGATDEFINPPPNPDYAEYSDYVADLGQPSVHQQTFDIMGHNLLGGDNDGFISRSNGFFPNSEGSISYVQIFDLPGKNLEEFHDEGEHFDIVVISGRGRNGDSFADNTELYNSTLLNRKVPEIDGAGAPIALALLAGIGLILRERRSKLIYI